MTKASPKPPSKDMLLRPMVLFLGVKCGLRLPEKVILYVGSSFRRCIDEAGALETDYAMYQLSEVFQATVSMAALVLTYNRESDGDDFTNNEDVLNSVMRLTDSLSRMAKQGKSAVAKAVAAGGVPTEQISNAAAELLRATPTEAGHAFIACALVCGAHNLSAMANKPVAAMQQRGAAVKLHS